MRAGRPRSRGSQSTLVGALAGISHTDSETLGESFRAPAHDDIVVPREEGPRDRREQIHPGFRRLDHPVIAHDSRRALGGQLPASAALQLTLGYAFDGRHRFDAREPHVECEAVRQLALPRVAPDAADAARVAWRDLDYALDAAPPRRAQLGMID